MVRKGNIAIALGELQVVNWVLQASDQGAVDLRRDFALIVLLRCARLKAARQCAFLL